MNLRLAMGVAMGLVLAAPAFAADGPKVPVPDDALLRHYFFSFDLPDGMAPEARLDADFNGDGQTDVAFVARDGDRRVLGVLLAYVDEFDLGHAPAGKAELPPVPLGPASLSMKKGVLVVEDLAGGTTATSASYRYRWEPKPGRMRLIGIDAERYSRTNSHDKLRFSWNLLTGAHEVVTGVLNRNPKSGDDAAYRDAAPDRTVQKSEPIYLEQTPDLDGLIDSYVIPEGEDRD